MTNHSCKKPASQLPDIDLWFEYRELKPIEHHSVRILELEREITERNCREYL